MKLLVATLFFSGVLSAPFTNPLNRAAAPECNTDASRFHTKKSLLYSYEGETLTGLVGTSEVRSGLKLTAKCQITPVLPCMYMLQILEAELLEGQGKNPDALDFKSSSGSADLSRELTARDLYFESHEGVITNIRPQAGEPVHVLNMKRGILSSFQLKLVDKDHTLTEVDVNGECSANYQIKARHDSGRVKTVLKKKDLSLCKDRSETNLGIPVTNYPTDKPFSLLKSDSLCRYVMSPLQRIGQISCEETHLFRPFSARYNSSSGAMTTVRQTIKLIGRGVTNDENPSIPVTEQFSLKYDHKKDPESSTKNHKEVAGILDKLGAEEGAKPDTARLFTKLIFAVRRLSARSLKIVWWQYYDCLEREQCTSEQSERYQKYIVDALSQCGTLDCAQFMVSTISENQVGTPQSVAFLTGIALIGKPSEDMVGNILYFCQETPSRTAFLTLGTLMHKYCSQHSCDNLNSRSPIYQADKFLQGKLHQNCQTSTPEELESTTLALKAIGNAGRPHTSVQNILKCAVHPGPSFVNVDAIQALRRMPCGDDMTQGLLSIFDDLTMDTEIRIETYLALMRCPSQKVIQKIADVLDAEKNNQVGSFVWSHLTNALESTEPVYGIPLRDAISQALQGRNLRQFKLDHLRFSHAYEASYYNKKYDFGGSSQAQVVFHPDSYFPRSAKFNFTVDVLGASVNLLETAARFEGFENFIENMFGPDGYFPDDRLMQLLKIKPTGASGRGRRSAAEDEMNEIKSNLEKLQDKMQIERKNPTGALSLKVFGHELQFLSFEDIDWLQGEADSINVIDTLINIARGGKVTYTKSFMLLEADHEIPTGLGFPLKLAVNGSGVSSVTLKGKFDIRNMFWGKKKLDVRGFVTPSATIEISGKMTVDATHALSGINVNSSLYTSTEINGNATYKEGEGIKLSVEPPTKPIYIINVKSNLATFLNERREKIFGSPRRFEHKNCANFTRFLGVQLCGHVSLPMAYRDYNAPYFPLSGESSFGMVFHTTNPNLARFELEGRKLTSEDENRYDWIFNVHVPGLTFGRKVVGNSTFQFLEDGKYLSVSCGVHDYKFGKFEAKYNNVTNRLHTKFSTPTMAYLKPITIETEIFNSRNNETKAQDIGIAINASYNNFTIQDVLSFHRHKDQYGFKSKFTYWPTKSITTEARFSLEKRHMYIKMDDSGSTNRFYFGGKLGKSLNRFYAKIGNDLMNYEIKMNGELNLNAKKVLMSIITKPSGNVIKFEAYPRWNALENGYYMRLSSVNSSSYITGYLGSSNLKRESTLKFNGMLMKKSFLFRTSHYVLSSGRRVEWVAQGLGNSANASIEYSAKRWSKNNLEFSAALNDKRIRSGVFLKQEGIGAYFVGMNKTINFNADYLEEGHSRGFSVSLEMDRHTQNSKQMKAYVEYAVGDEGKDLKFGIEGLGYSTILIWSYYNYDFETGLKVNAFVSNTYSAKRFELLTGLFRDGDEKGLRVKANVLGEEFEARWSLLTGDNSGMKFTAHCMNTQLSLQSTWRSYENVKVWRVDTTYANKTASLISTYLAQEKYVCSEIAGLSAGRLEACLQLVSNDRERALRLVGEVFGRTAEMKVGWIQNTESMGAVLKTTYNGVKVSDFFAGRVTHPSYKGLSFKGTVKEKSVEALLKYKNTHLKRSLDLDLRFQGKLVTFESMLVRESDLQGAQINMVYESKQVGSVFALLHKKPSSNVFKIGGKAMNYGAEYKLSLANSKLERKLSSMVIFTAHSKHFKYGYSISHSNLGTYGQHNHVITSKLHYAKDKILTSTYQFINSQQSLNLLSKMELAPGQFLTNKLTYYKPNRKLSIKYEMLPGIGITYLAAFINDNQHMGIQSNLTILNYPMGSSVILNKQSGFLTCTLTYCSVRPPVEFTTHLQRNNGIDFGFALSALDHIWNGSVLMDYSSKQLQLSIDVLPNIPIEVFAKLFENKQFVFNITTSSAFSVELAGTTLTKDVYTLVLKHEFLNTIFEDFMISISSLQHLNKLRLRWESKSGRNFIKNLNVTVERLLDGSLASLANVSVSARKVAFDILNYMRNDGREKLMAALHESKEKIIYLKELLRDLDVNKLAEKYFVRTDELLKRVKRALLELVDEMKPYSVPLRDTYNYMEQMIKDISSELSPYTKLFTLDLKKWLSRTVNRYLNVPICGITIEQLIGMITKKTQLYYTMVKDNIQKQVEMWMKKCQEIKSVLKEMEDLAEKAKTTVQDFTCNYNLECTKRNVQLELKKLARYISQDKVERVLERLNKTIEQLTLKYKKIESYVLLTVKENHLQERAMKLLQPVIDSLTTVTRTLKLKVISLREKVNDIIRKSDMMVFYHKMKAQHKDLLKALGKAKEFTTRNFEVGKENLFNRLDELLDSLKSIKIETLVVYQKSIKLIHELRNMSWEEVEVYAKNEIEINYEKLKENLIDLRATVMEKVKSCLKRHANDIEQLKKLGKTIYTTCNDTMNGRISARDVKAKVELLLKKLMDYLKEQKLLAMNKIKDLKLGETVKKTYKSAVELYRKTTQDLRMNVTTLYPKIIEELKSVLLKIKKAIVKYVELAKIHVVELRDEQMIHLKKALAKLLDTKKTMIKRAHEILQNYKELSLAFVEDLELDIVKLMEKYQRRLNETIAKYKVNLTTTVERVKTKILNTLTLYQDMPIENIYADLRLKANEAFDKLLGFIIGKSLISYEEALEKIKIIKEFYRSNREFMEAKWKNISDVVQELNQKYRALVIRKYMEASKYLLENIQHTRITTEVISALKDFSRKIMFVTEARFEQLKLWYEHVKYMKFKELYHNMKNLSAKWDLHLKDCCEKVLKAWIEEFNQMKATLQDFIHEVKDESKNVILRVQEANEDVKRDTIETFGPYEKRVRDVLLKHMTKIAKKLAPLKQKYEKVITLLAEYKNTTEQYVRQCYQDIMDLDQDKIMDMVTASLKRWPLLAEVRNYYEFVRKEYLAIQIIESLNRFPFLYQVRTHKLWSILKQEFLDHEIVTGSQELGKSSVKKLKELSTDYSSRSLSKILELRDNAYERLGQFKTNLFLRNERIKKTIKDKREDINLKLRDTHAKLRLNVEKLMEEATEMYESGYKKLQETAERIGEVSIHDIESRIRQYLRNLLAPVKVAYVDLSDAVVAELLILDKYHRELQERIIPLRKSLMMITNEIRNRFEDMSTKVNEWGMRAWANSKSELVKIEKLSAKILDHLENVTTTSMAAGQRLIDDYILHKDLLKMTPHELIKRAQDVPLKAEKVFKLVQAVTERFIQSSMRMFKELKNSVNPQKIQEMKHKAELLLNNTRGQMHFLATEILETTVFVTKFYGSPDTVYSAHPEMAKFADYHLQRFINHSRIFKEKAIKYYNETRDIVEKIFAKVNYAYQNKLPQLVKYIKTEIKDLNTENVRKLHKMAKVFLNMSKEYVAGIYAETLASLELSRLILREFLTSTQSEVTLKLNQAKEQLEKFLKTEAGKKFNETYKKILVAFEDVKELIRSHYDEILVYSRNLNERCKSYMTMYFNADIISDFPILVKNAIGRLPLILDMVKRDLKTLMNDCFDKLHEGTLYIQDEVFPKVKQSYASNVNTLNKHFLQLKKTTNDVMHSVNKDIKEELPLIKELILNIINIIRKSEIALISGELELNHPPIDELRKIVSDLYTAMSRKYNVVYPMLEGLYQDSKEASKEILERLLKDSKETLKYLREDVPKFCKTKFTELRELAQPKLTSLSSSAEMALQELKKMQKVTHNFCKEKGLIFFNKGKEAKQLVLYYVKMLFERSKGILEDMKKQVSGFEWETRFKIEKLRNQVIELNNDLLKAIEENKKELEKKVVAFYNSNEIKKYINKYIDVDDLMNKTIEIKEDILNTTLAQDLVHFGEMCYAEGRRLYNLTKESSEFAMYVIKRAVKYSDVWEIVEELTNPFHWIPPSNSIAMIFGKPHVYTFDGQSYQFVGYKKPSCTYVLAHDFRDNNFTIMSQETALIVNTKAGYIKIHESGKIEATVSKDAEGKEIKTTYTELPVEMMQMSIRREGSFIKIKHDTGVDVVCDLRHFFCTFNINKFYHGKLAGLLGTNNNEQYDEFLKPDKTIAKSIAEFANAWEVSGDPECKVSGAMELKSSCEKKPSPRCKELFISSSSPLAPYFRTVDPKPFYDACLFDTSDCKTDVPPSESFCNVTAAYTALLREKGVWARQLHECASCGSKGVWQTWTQRGSKNVDVVLLIPETLHLQTHADNLPSFLKGLETDLSKYKPRYAVVGFGGKTAVRRRPHIVTGGGKIFGGINDVQSAIANMKFTTEKANAFEAIEYLAHLPFLPGASKVVIMIEDQNREAISSAPLQRAIKELDMQGVIFNVIGPYFQKKQHRNVLGLWKDQAMMKKDTVQSKFKTIGLPSNNNIRLAESSQGAIFNLKAYSKAHGDWSNLLKRAMKTTIVKQIDEDQTYCRQCVCIPGLTTEPVTICRINKHSRCS